MNNDLLSIFSDSPIIFLQHQNYPKVCDYYHSILEFELCSEKNERSKIILQRTPEGGVFNTILCISPLSFRKKVRYKNKNKLIFSPFGWSFKPPSKASIRIGEIKSPVFKINYTLIDITCDNGYLSKLYVPSFMKSQIESIKNKAIQQELYNG